MVSINLAAPTEVLGKHGGMKMDMDMASSTAMAMSSATGMDMGGMSMSGMSGMSGMSMSGSSAMNMASSTASAAMSTSTGMDMGGMDMGGMDMGEGSCNIAMIWNWNVKDTCFLAEGWHVKTKGQFAGTCIGIFLWVMFLVYFRRARTDFDAYIVRNRMRRLARAAPQQSGPDDDSALQVDRTSEGRDVSPSPDRSSSPQEKLGEKVQQFSFRRNPLSVDGATAGFTSLDQPQNIRPTLFEQLIRALMFGFEYSIVWLVGLILMSYNGYVIISAFLGAFFGFLLTDWGNLQLMQQPSKAPTCC